MNKQDKMAAGSLAVIVLGMCVGTSGLLRTPSPTNSSPPPTNTPTPPIPYTPPVRPTIPYTTPSQTSRDRTRYDVITKIERDLDAFWHTELQADGKILTYVEFTFKNQSIPQFDPATFGRPQSRYGQILGLGIRGTRHAFSITGNMNHYSGTLDIRIEPGLTLDLYENNSLGQTLIRTFGPDQFGDYWRKP